MHTNYGQRSSSFKKFVLLILLALPLAACSSVNTGKTINSVTAQGDKSKQVQAKSTSENKPFAWVSPSAPDHLSLDTVSCPSSSRCIGFSNSIYWVSEDGGSTWTQQKFLVANGDASLLDGWSFGPSVVNCHSDLCVAYSDSYGYPPADFYTISVDGGLTWSVVKTGFPSTLVQNNYQTRAVDCPSETDCFVIFDNSAAAGGIEADSRPASFIESTKDGGSSWHSLTLSPGDQNTPYFSNSLLTSIACPTAVHCVAVGESYLPPGPAIFATNDGGASWDQGDVNVDETGFIGVSCPEVKFCLATGLHGNNEHDFFKSTDGGIRWSMIELIDPQAEFVTCISESTCLSGGQSENQTGALWTTTNGGQSWSLFTTNPDEDFSAGACASDTRCVASGALPAGTEVGNVKTDGSTLSVPKSELIAAYPASSSPSSAMLQIIGSYSGGTITAASDPSDPSWVEFTVSNPNADRLYGFLHYADGSWTMAPGSPSNWMTECSIPPSVANSFGYQLVSCG